MSTRCCDKNPRGCVLGLRPRYPINNPIMFPTSSIPPITLRPTTKQEWFTLWLVLVIIIVLICLCIMIIERPLDEYDFIGYISEKSDYRGETLPRSQVEANIYALTHNPSHLSDLSSEQLLYLPSEYIPNLADFVEDDV